MRNYNSNKPWPTATRVPFPAKHGRPSRLGPSRSRPWRENACNWRSPISLMMYYIELAIACDRSERQLLVVPRNYQSRALISMIATKNSIYPADATAPQR